MAETGIAAEFMEKFGRSFGDAAAPEKAFALISKMCKASGLNEELYYAHNIGVAEILLEMGMEKGVVTAGLIHNIVKHGIPEKDVAQAFGEKTLAMVQEKMRLEKALLFKPLDKENSRKKLIIVLSANQDVVMLELAERLDILRKIGRLPKEKKHEFLNETKDIFANLAHKIGVYYISTEMNDLIFRHREPEKYALIEKEVQKIVEKGRHDVQNVKARLEDEMGKAGIKASVVGRTKTVYSTFEKMQRKKNPLQKVMDINALRVIVESEKDSYEALGIIHSNWKAIPGEFDDYIAKPKANGYRSLHTTVTTENGNAVEIQVRTKEMNDFAEFGGQSHWMYKGEEADSKYDRKIEWMKQVLEWKKEENQSTEMDLFGGQVFAMTPKGQVIELPEGATVIDFAYAVHTEIGNRCQSAKINGNIASLNTQIKNGDVVEITTSQSQTPKVSWLNFAKTSKAKSKIRVRLNIKKTPENAAMRRSMSHAIKTDSTKVRLAKCCSPVPGDNIIGFKTKKRKISVHRADCPEAAKLGLKKLDVEWRNEEQNYEVNLSVKANDRITILKDLLETFSKSNVKVNYVNAKKGQANTTVCSFRINVRNRAQLEALAEKIENTRDVLEVIRE